MVDGTSITIQRRYPPIFIRIFPLNGVQKYTEFISTIKNIFKKSKIIHRI